MRSRPRASGVVALIVLFGSACGSTPSGPSPAEQRDGQALTQVLVHDQGTSAAFERADHLYDDRRPAAAAVVLRDEAVTRLRRSQRELREVSLETSTGRSLRESLVALYGRRLRAVERYAAALATTEENEELLESMREHRLVEDELAGAWREVHELAGGRATAAPAAATGTR